MIMLRRYMLALMLCASSQGVALQPAWADLREYVDKSEPAFKWTVRGNPSADPSGDRVDELNFVSQTWQEKNWQHQLQIYRPQNAAPSASMFLWVTGGSANGDTRRLGMDLARRIGAAVAFLYDIPNQPLLEGNLYEDDLIAETFVRYLATGDETWPLLFPMVKSVVKAMDVLQAFSARQSAAPVNKFIVAGASKRGWTAWLTAAVDPRVAALAPVVIDTLNMRAQMPRQLQAFGGYSSRLAPYSSRGLLPIPQTAAGQRLLHMVDPWSYRERLTMPKLIINGTNDFYWATDALNIYWSGIPSPKWVFYVPNAGHNLRRQDRPQAEQLSDLITALAAFTRHQISGTPMPNVSWRYEGDGGAAPRLIIAAEPAPKAGRLWVAQAPTKDFRTATWISQELQAQGSTVVAELGKPAATGSRALFAELDYAIDGLPYRLSTQMWVAGPASAK